MDLSPLFEFQSGQLKQTDNHFVRSLFENINWKQRMFGIKGLRGTGKTTLLLQYQKFYLQEKALYVTADHPWFYDNTLLDLADTFDKNDGKVLLIDEIHKYPGWSRELKNIYDGYPGLRVIFTASSALEILKGEADLSRRVITYELPGLSFREFIRLKYDITIEKVPLKELLKKSASILEWPSRKRPLPLFKEYLKSGYFPFSMNETDATFDIKINQIINTVLESDLAIIEEYTASNVVKIKKLLGVLSESAPFTPNISALASKMSLGRDTVNMYLHHLERSRMLNLIRQKSKGVASLQKPDKVYLENTNFSYALKFHPETGTLRETFFLNQLINAGHKITLPPTGDFLVDDFHLFEVGGKSKTGEKMKGIKNNFLALDEIEVPSLNKIPLWGFGLLY